MTGISNIIMNPADLVDTPSALLSGLALDWAVAEAERLPVAIVLIDNAIQQFFDVVTGYRQESGRHLWTTRYNPSIDWYCGGHIIERARIEIHHNLDLPLTGGRIAAAARPYTHLYVGATALEAAMRAFIVARLGQVATIPAQLVGAHRRPNRTREIAKVIA